MPRCRASDPLRPVRPSVTSFRTHPIGGLRPGFGYRIPMFSWLKKMFSGKAAQAPQEQPTAAPADDEAPTVSDPVVGYYVDPHAPNLPTDIVVGHGLVILHALTCDRLLLDGVDVGDPVSRAPEQPFLGFFNVPPGRHTLVLERQGQRSSWSFELAPNATELRSCDWSRGGLVAADADTEQQQRDQARSGASLRSGALRPWPLASVFFQGAPESVTIDGHAVPTEATRVFFGVTGLAPGAHQVRLGDATVALKLPESARVLLSCGPGGAEVQDGHPGTMLIKVLMMHAPREALWPLSAMVPELAAPITEPIAEPPASSAPPATPESTPGGPPRFNDADLEHLRATFTRLQSEYEEQTIAEYVEILRRHYIQDREMAQQADYFIRYTAELQLQVEALPRITASQAMTHLRYLSEDLQDTGVSALAALGRKLSAALDKAGTAAN